jgi:hypothetical protein
MNAGIFVDFFVNFGDCVGVNKLNLVVAFVFVVIKRIILMLLLVSVFV